ncbi:MAG: hypothetical protein HKN26_06480 [Acidimicrobiales bacterium]|nr:hypothetical protein [Acidimicrobiales bacterium]
MKNWAKPLVVLGALALLASACNYAYGPFLARIDGPVVLTATDLGVENLNLDPDRAVGYRWDATNTQWVQIPVQVDERHVVDFGSKPSNNNQAGTVGTVYGTSAIGVTALQYSDAGTWVGADPDATFDADDEIVFMSRDAGPQAPGGTADPPNTIGGLGKAIELVDPDGGTSGYVYLFYGTASVDSSAGVDLVDYNFVLDAGTYLNDYKRADGPNPESSTVTTPWYSMGFSDRWFTVDLDVGNGDILDGHKSRFGLNTCIRSNATFANAWGAFAANIDGPLRAIRSYIGANSGPITQRTEIFYDARYESITDLRVHSIPGVMSFWDLNTNAIGMEYGNSNMAGTVTVDGSPDTVPSATPDWSYVHGSQGYVTNSFELTASFSPPTAQVYVDDTTPPYTECWGDDGDFLGAAGVDITGGLPNTDPRNAPFETFVAHEVAAFWPTNLDPAAWTPIWADQALQPLAATITDF